MRHLLRHRMVADRLGMLSGYSERKTSAKGSERELTPLREVRLNGPEEFLTPMIFGGSYSDIPGHRLWTRDVRDTAR